MAKKKKKQQRASSAPLLLIAAPGILYLLINNYIPMFGIFLAFKDFNYRKGIFGSDWNGLDNFRFLFKTHDAWVMTRNTIQLAMPVGLVSGLLRNWRAKMKAPDLWYWLGANHSDTQWYREDLQRRQGGKDAVLCAA